MHFKIIICLILINIMGWTQVQAQLSDISRLTEEDYINFKLPPLDTLFRNALENPKIKINEAKIKGEVYQLRVERKSWLSFFNVRTGYNYGILGNYASVSDDNQPLITTYSGHAQHNYSIGAQIVVPFHNLFNYRAEIQKQKQRVAEAQYNTEVSIEELKIQIIDIYSRTLSGLNVLKSKAELVAYTTAHYRIVESDFVNNRTTTEILSRSKAEQEKAQEGYELFRADVNSLILQLEIITRTKLTNK